MTNKKLANGKEVKRAVKSEPKKYIRTGTAASEEQLTFTGRVKRLLRTLKIDKGCCKAAFSLGKSFPKGETTIEQTRAFHCTSCASHFLRGVFLTAGSVNAPNKGHHLEIKTDGSAKAVRLVELLAESGLEAKVFTRRSSHIVYLKDGDAIFAFLSLIGAQKCAFDFLEVMIEKQVRNDCNRKTNFDAANMQKAANAGRRQLEAIRYFYDAGTLEELSEVLQYTARLKYENPSLNLSELAALHDPPITKSCVNHRLNKLIETYERACGLPVKEK